MSLMERTLPGQDLGTSAVEMEFYMMVSFFFHAIAATVAAKIKFPQRSEKVAPLKK